MKRILIALLAATGIYAQAATISSNNLAPATINNLIPTNQLLISSVVLVNSTTTNATITLIDSPRGVLLWTNSAYTSRVVTLGNVTNIYTNFLGVIETNMITNVVVGGFVTNSGATNAFRVLATLGVPANNSVTYIPSTPLVTSYGLTVTNNPNVNITVNYSNVR